MLRFHCPHYCFGYSFIVGPRSLTHPMTSPQYIRRSFIPGHALSLLHKATELFYYDDSNHIMPETISLTRPHELHHRCSYLSKAASRFILTKKEGFRLYSFHLRRAFVFRTSKLYSPIFQPRPIPASNPTTIIQNAKIVEQPRQT